MNNQNIHQLEESNNGLNNIHVIPDSQKTLTQLLEEIEEPDINSLYDMPLTEWDVPPTEIDHNNYLCVDITVDGGKQ